MKYNALKFIIIVFFFNLFFIANLININHFNCIAMNLNNVNQFEQPISINETNFPDVNFRKWLTNSNNLNGSGADGIFTIDEIATIEEIYIKADVNNLISSLKGIEFFTNLKDLIITNNALSSLDLSNNINLEYVNCSYNKLTNLNTNNLLKLQTLFCEFNYLTSLDLSDNTELTTLYCRHNLLDKLNLNNNQKLIFIETFDNLITDIDISMLSNLQFIHIDHNKLTEFDISNNLNLVDGGFVVRNNDLRELILPNIENFTIYYDDFAEQNPILGYDRLTWYLDKSYTNEVTSDVIAQGQTLYGKRIANDYTINFSSNGGINSPQPIKTQYNKQTALPLVEPTRIGYKFKGWSPEFENTKIYLSGETVTNLAGKTQGENITLYAQWEPIKYIISFNPNNPNATGNMEDIVAEYGNSIILPSNKFSQEKYDFIGWSLTPNGPVKYADLQSVLNLANNENQTITLYAVWELNSHETQKPYILQLENLLNEFSSTPYYTEDWNRLLAYYINAKENVANSNKNTNKMASIIETFKKNSQLILSENNRINEIVNGWESEFNVIINLTKNPPFPLNFGKNLLLNLENALVKSELANLKSYSTLTNIDNLTDASIKAKEIIKDKIQQLNFAKNSLIWLANAEDYYDIPLVNINSSMVNSYNDLYMSYFSLTEQENKFIDNTILEKVTERLVISSYKKDSLLKLENDFNKYLKTNYYESDWQKMETIYNSAIAKIETSKSVIEIDEELLFATKEMDNVLTINEKPLSSNSATLKNTLIILISAFLILLITLIIYLTIKKYRKSKIVKHK